MERVEKIMFKDIVDKWGKWLVLIVISLLLVCITIICIEWGNETEALSVYKKQKQEEISNIKQDLIKANEEYSTAMNSIEYERNAKNGFRFLLKDETLEKGDIIKVENCFISDGIEKEYGQYISIGGCTTTSDTIFVVMDKDLKKLNSKDNITIYGRFNNFIKVDGEVIATMYVD